MFRSFVEKTIKKKELNHIPQNMPSSPLGGLGKLAARLVGLTLEGQDMMLI